MSTDLKLRDLAVSDTGFVFDPYTGATYSLNGPGIVLLRGIRDGLGRGELVDQLADRFEVTDHDLRRDVDEFVQQLREEGLVAIDFVLPESGGAGASLQDEQAASTTQDGQDLHDRDGQDDPL